MRPWSVLGLLLVATSAAAAEEPAPPRDPIGALTDALTQRAAAAPAGTAARLRRAVAVLERPTVGVGEVGGTAALRRAARVLQRARHPDGEAVALVDTAAATLAAELDADARTLARVLAAGLLDAESAGRAAAAARRGDRGLAGYRTAQRRGPRLRRLAHAARALSVVPELGLDAGTTYHHVVVTLRIAPAIGGFDWTGDGVPENALAQLQSLVGPLTGGLDMNVPTASGIVSGALSEILQVAAVGSLDGDEIVLVGHFHADDVDGDPSDNAFGGEQFTPASGARDARGHAAAGAAAALGSGGAYEVEVAGRFAVPFGLEPIAVADSVRLRGNVTTDTHSGTLGMLVPGSVVFRCLAAFVPAQFSAQVPGVATSLLDVDTDGDGTADAMSAAFTFQAVRAELP